MQKLKNWKCPGTLLVPIQMRNIRSKHKEEYNEQNRERMWKSLENSGLDNKLTPEDI